MLKASRIGTPEATSVPSVREVRATIVFSTMVPKIGVERLMPSIAYAPVPFKRINLSNSHRPKGNNGSVYQYWPNHRDVSISFSVSQGSVSWKSLKIFSNFGMMYSMMNVKMPMATKMTTTG